MSARTFNADYKRGAGKADKARRKTKSEELVATIEGLSEHDAMLEIQTLLDGVEWTPDTLDSIAQILERTGYKVRDLNDREVQS